MLILHEIMHLLLGHTRIFKRSTPVLNYAFDAIINAHICHLFPKIEYTSFFRSLYSPFKLPEALLRPPDGYSAGNPKWVLPGAAGELHKALYTNQEVTTTEVVEMMKRFFKESSLDFSKDKLLGNHEEQDDGQNSGDNPESEIDPELLKEIKEIVARWPREKIIGGRDDGGEMTQDKININSPVRAFINTIRLALLSLLEQKDFLKTLSKNIRSETFLNYNVPASFLGKRLHLN